MGTVITLIDRIFYSFYCIKCWTSIPRFYLAIKLIRLCHFLNLDGVGNWIGEVSGLSARLKEVFPDLFTDHKTERSRFSIGLGQPAKRPVGKSGD